MSEKWAERLDRSLVHDPFAEGVNMVRYELYSVEVDGVYRHRNQDRNTASMISIRSIASDTAGGYRYMHDGYPIDEEHYVKYDCISSTTDDENSWFYCSDSLHHANHD